MTTEQHAAAADQPGRPLRCILHIGTEKTGTSTLQHFLSNNRAQLAREGIVYPRFTGPNGGSQWGFVAAVADNAWQSDIGARLDINDRDDALHYRSRLVAAIDAEIASCPQATTLLISSEHFHSRLSSPELVERLRNLLSRWADDFHVLVYFRRQDKVAVSHYSTKLKSGNPDPQVFPDTRAGLPYYYDYAQIYDTWTTVFGGEAVTPRLFAPEELEGGDLLADFCANAGIKVEGKTRPKSVNESLDERGVALLLELNRQWPLTRQGYSDLTRRGLAAFIGRTHRGKSFPATRAEALDFYEQCRDSNARLHAAAFPNRSGALFADDFAGYPQQRSLPDQNVDGEVGTMIAQWQRHRLKDTQQLSRRRRILNTAGSALVRGSAAAARLQHAAATRIRRRWQQKPSGLPPLYLHVGLPKTGTTTLQNTLFTHHPDLYFLGKSQNYDFPRGCRSQEIHDLLNPLLWRKGRQPGWRQLRRRLKEQLADVGGRPLLGSWETLGIQRLTTFQRLIYNMEAAFGDIRIVFTLRDPLSRIPSAYLHALKSASRRGGHHTLPKGAAFVPFDQWLHNTHTLDGHDYRFDFGDNMRFAVEHLGRERVGIFLLEHLKEDPEGYFRDIAKFMGVDANKATRVERQHLNPALTVDQVAVLQKYQNEDRAGWQAMRPRERRALLKEALENGSGEPYKVQLDASQRTYIIERSRPVNQWLSRTFALELERFGYPL